MARSQNTSNRGFASMDEEKQREIARKGGESVPDEKRSFSKDRELASEAGRKGGQHIADEKRSFSKDHEFASEAGRNGIRASAGGVSAKYWYRLCGDVERPPATLAMHRASSVARTSTAYLLDFFFGTFLPSLRASENPWRRISMTSSSKARPSTSVSCAISLREIFSQSSATAS
jgi:uncharacterized protein